MWITPLPPPRGASQKRQMGQIPMEIMRMGVTPLPALATMNLPGTLSARQITDPACPRQV